MNSTALSLAASKATTTVAKRSKLWAKYVTTWVVANFFEDDQMLVPVPSFYPMLLVTVVIFGSIYMIFAWWFNYKWRQHEKARRAEPLLWERMVESGWPYYKSSGGSRNHLYRRCQSIRDTLDTDISLLQICGNCKRDYGRQRAARP